MIKWDENKPRVSSEPKITIRKDGVIALNQACYDKHFRGIENVILGFEAYEGNDTSSTIIIKPAFENEKAQRKLRTLAGKYPAISATSFLKNHYNLFKDSVFKSHLFIIYSFPVKWNDKDNWLECHIEQMSYS